MKKIAIAVLGLAALLVTPVGFTKDISIGTISIGGDMDARYVSGTVVRADGTEYDSTSMGMNVGVLGYFVPNLAVGVLFSYDGSEVKAGSTTMSDKSINYGLGVRYDIGISNELNARLKAGYVLGSSSEDDGTTKTDSDMSAYVVAGGIAYFLNNNVSLDADIRYQSVSVKDAYDDRDIGVSVGLSVYLGGN